MRGKRVWNGAALLAWLLLFAATAAARTGVVNTNDLNLRNSPQIVHGNIIGKLNSGDRVTILAQDSRWLQVRTDAGLTGWVDMDYVDEATRAVVNTNDLNLRTGPVIRADNVIGKLNAGDAVIITGRQGRWLQVRTESGRSGWVDMDFVDEDAAPAPAVRTTAPPPQDTGRHTAPGGPSARVNADQLNLRSAPDLTANNVIGRLVLDAEVTVLEDRGEWLRVRTGSGTEGWAAAVYFDRDGFSNFDALIKNAQDIFHASYSIERVTFIDGSEQFKEYKPSRVMEAYNIVNRLLHTPGFTEHDTALLLRGKCLTVIGWYSHAFDPGFFKQRKDDYRANGSAGNYVYSGADFKRIMKEFPKSNLADDAAFELANLPRPGGCEDRLDCHFSRELDAFSGFLTEYPDSTLARRAIELINAAGPDLIPLSDDLDRGAAGSYAFERDKLIEHIERYRRLMSNHPNPDRVYALHAIADSFAALGLKDRALHLYDAIIEKFPRYEMIEHIKQSRDALKSK